MTTIARRVLTIAIAVIGTYSTPSPAQDIVDKPALNVGDLWVFHETGTEAGRPVDRQWRRRIAETLADGMVRVTPKYKGIDVFDASWNPRDPNHPESWAHDFEFPLRVGAEWTFDSPIGASDKEGLFYRLHGHQKVVAFESITVPAGTFDCFRLEGASYLTSATSRSHQTWTNTYMWRMTRWYCPQVKYLAKLRIDYSAAGASIGAVGGTLDSELVRFTPRCETPRPGARAGTRPSPYDGEWGVARSCEAFQERPAFTDDLRADLQGGEIVVEYGTPGRPGYSCVSGRVSANGDLALDGTGIAAAKAVFGREFAAHFDGRFDGDRFVLNGNYGARKCSLVLTRGGAR